ncbi:hypothetical protein [Candidatus Phytoplasma sp. AldY-WA1]|uniref:hypothetical protein n=1 Tax=Candidatus Phytoplasma sp. AldY-WA1 TaxID=2852100 RepID=UPI00254B8DC9|nr:hypothetical protein [Candidatus Phytoplasma sp. AldY-WA1]
MTIVLNWVLTILMIIGTIISFKFFTNNLKSEINLLNDKIDKHFNYSNNKIDRHFHYLNNKIDKYDNKLNNINKNFELLEKEMLYHRENLDEIKKIGPRNKRHNNRNI